MWTYTYKKKVSNISTEQLWSAWTDVNNWHKWQDDIEHAKLKTDFAPGAKIDFRPKGGPNVKIEITEVVPNKLFIDVTRFPLAKMTDSHELVKVDDGVEVVTTLTLTGPLSFLWKKLVVQEIADSLEGQTDSLINYTKKQL